MSRARRHSIGPQQAFTNNLSAGAAVGAAAYVVNYVLMYLFVTIDGADAGPFETWNFAGNILYNAQFVSTEYNGGGRIETINFVTESSSNDLLAAYIDTDIGSTIPTLVYHIVPIVVLLVAGVIAAKRMGSRLDTQSAAAAGATVMPGVLVLSVLGIFLFEESDSGITVAPELAMGVLLVGVVIPLILGAIGGAISNEL